MNKQSLLLRNKQSLLLRNKQSLLLRNKPYLSVIIPCYNEEDNLKRDVLLEVENFLARQPYPSEVIVSDDGSTDKSQETAENFIKKHPRFRLLKNPHQGKPFAVRAGMLASQGEITLFSDMDQSTPIAEIDKLLPYFKQGFEVVIGSRGKERKEFPWYRKLLSWGFRFARSFFLLGNIVDTQCGFKAFRTKEGRKIFEKMQIFKEAGKTKGWKVGAWDVEFLFVAEKLGFKIKEIPVSWMDKDVASGKKRDFVKESKEMFWEILRVMFNNWKGRYD